VKLTFVPRETVALDVTVGKGEPDPQTGVAIVRDREHRPSEPTLIAASVGVAPASSPLGMIVGGRRLFPWRGTSRPDETVGLYGTRDGAATLGPSNAVPAGTGSAVELLRLRLGQTSTPADADRGKHAALGRTPAGDLLFAQTLDGTWGDLAQALTRAGCVLAARLDRGADASATIERVQRTVAGHESGVQFVLRKRPPPAFRATPKLP
jgi:hypothetical protein